MTLSLYIKNKSVYDYLIDENDFQTVQQRSNIVIEMIQRIKEKYRMDIMIHKDWEIILTVKSSMNEIHPTE